MTDWLDLLMPHLLVVPILLPLFTAAVLLFPGEQARVARHSTHAARGGIMHDSAQHVTLVISFGGSDAGQESFRGLVAGGLHLEHIEDIRLGKGIQRLPADPMHDLAEEDEVHITVAEHRARSGIGSAGEGSLDPLVIA